MHTSTSVTSSRQLFYGLPSGGASRSPGRLAAVASDPCKVAAARRGPAACGIAVWQDVPAWQMALPGSEYRWTGMAILGARLFAAPFNSAGVLVVDPWRCVTSGIGISAAATGSPSYGRFLASPHWVLTSTSRQLPWALANEFWRWPLEGGGFGPLVPRLGASRIS